MGIQFTHSYVHGLFRADRRKAHQEFQFYIGTFKNTVFIFTGKFFLSFI